MKRLFTLLLFCGSSLLFAQNWSPILVNEKMNYQLSDSSYISHSIWVEDVSPQGNDTIYELNKIVIDCPGEPLKVLRNQPSFFQQEMTKLDSGDFHFSLPQSYYIKTWAKMWDSWQFDPASNITATVAGHNIMDVLGIPDSVKYINLSDGSQIQLSKNFGIIRFPDFENGGYFELVGIQDADIGKSVIDFWDIFDFEVGDVFQYEFQRSDAEQYWHEIQKYSVESKNVFDDSINYQFHKIIDGHFINWVFWDESYYSHWANETISYIDSSNHPASNFNFEFVTMWDNFNGLYWYNNNIIFSRTTLLSDSLDKRTKEMGGRYFSSPFNDVELFKEIDSNNDTLDRCYNWYQIFITYTEGLGHTIYEFWDDEQASSSQMVGYVKNGDTVGIITPDSLLLTGISKQKVNSNNCLVYPNPATDWINIKFQYATSKGGYTLELRNLYGQLVKEEKNIQSPKHVMNVADLDGGVYFYLIREKENTLKQGKLIIQ